MRLQTGPSRMGNLEIGKCLHHTHPTWKKINCIGLSVSGLLNLCQKIHVTCPFPQPLSQRKTSSSYFQWKYLLIQAGCGNCMSLIPELRRKGKADLCEFRPASAIEWVLVSKIHHHHHYLHRHQKGSPCLSCNFFSYDCSSTSVSHPMWTHRP